MLTDTQVRGAKPGKRPRRFGDGHGLYLRVDATGGRYWRFNYRFSGKQKTLALGVYPEVSLAKARLRLCKARELLADGIDPSARKKESSKTFEAVAREWHARWSAQLHSRHAQYVLKRLEEDVFPWIGTQLPSAIPTSAFRDVVQKIEARGALEIARRGSGLGVTRWIIERTIAWLHQFRRLRLRYERLPEIHEAFLKPGRAVTEQRARLLTHPPAVEELRRVLTYPQ